VLKPWARVLYWFAMLMDAERIERDIEEIREVRRATLGAFGFHQPEELDRIRDRALADLQMPQHRLTPAELIAYALEQQRRVKGEVN
jgi:hypothetical protein